MKWYKKFVLEAEKGIAFEVSDGTNEELIIRARNIAKDNVNSRNSSISKEHKPINKNKCNTKKIATANVHAKSSESSSISKGHKHVSKNKSNTKKVATTNVHAKSSESSSISKGHKHVSKNKNNTKKVATANVYSENYINPPIPKGYKHVCGKWNNGFVIERASDGSQFVWIPVGSLDSNGTLDGVHFSEKFGRRNYMNHKFSDNAYNEDLNGELLEQFESVKKYGGFYISRYNISKNSEEKPQSIKGVEPWVNINFYNAKKIASTIEDNEAVKSHLTFGAEYDSVLEWVIKTEVKTLAEIAKSSTEWGNYRDTENSPKDLVETGSREKWCANNIYDFAGNVAEKTQEKNKNLFYVSRGGGYNDIGACLPVARRSYGNPKFGYADIGFRAVLYIK